MGLLRLLGLVYGLVAAAGVLASRRGVARVTERLVAQATETSAPESAAPAEPPRPSRTVTGVRLGVGALGVVVLLVGAWKVVHAVLPMHYLALVIILLLMAVVHDGVLVPVVNVLRAVAHRFSGLSAPALAVLKGGFVVAGVLVLVVVPAIWAKHLSPLNPTILPGSYGLRLAVTLGVIAVLTAAGIVLVQRRSGRPRRRA